MHKFLLLTGVLFPPVLFKALCSLHFPEIPCVNEAESLNHLLFFALALRVLKFDLICYEGCIFFTCGDCSFLCRLRSAFKKKSKTSPVYSMIQHPMNKHSHMNVTDMQLNTHAHLWC